MTASVELNDFALGEWSEPRAVLVARVAWLRPVHLAKALPSVFCFGLTRGSVSLLTAVTAGYSLDVISTANSSVAITVKHGCPN